MVAMWPNYWSALRDFARKRGRGRGRSSRSSSFRRLASTDSGSIARCRMKGSKATSWIRPRSRHPVGVGVRRPTGAAVREREGAWEGVLFGGASTGKGGVWFVLGVGKEKPPPPGERGPPPPL